MKTNIIKTISAVLLLAALFFCLTAPGREALAGWQTSIFSPTNSKYKIPNTTVAISLTTSQAPVVDVRRFGAKIDGATNDTTSVQAAIDYATSLSTGATVWIPRGICLLSSSIELKSNVRLLGDGAATTLKRNWNNASANGVIQVTGARSNCSVENLLIEGNSGVHTASGNFGIYGLTGGYSNVKVVNCTIQNSSGSGIIFLAATGAHGSQVTVDHCSVLNGGSHGIIFQDYVDNAYITNNYVYRCSLTTADRPGITMGRNAVNQVCSGNVVDLNNEAFTGTTSQHGISIDTASYVVCNDNIVKQVIGYGIEVGYVTNGVFAGNTIDTAGARAGIALSANASTVKYNTNVSIVGNSITNSNASGSGHGIYAFVSSPDGVTFNQQIVIANNTIRGTSSGTDIGIKHGISVDNTKRLSITGNLIRATYNAGIYSYRNDIQTISNNTVEACNQSASASYAGVRVLTETGYGTDCVVLGNQSLSNGNSNLITTHDGVSGALSPSVTYPNTLLPYSNNTVALGATGTRFIGYFSTLASNSTATFTGGVTITTNPITASTYLTQTPTFTDPTALNLGIDQTTVLSAGATAMSAETRGANFVTRVDGTGGINSSILARGVHGDGQYNQSAGTATSATVVGVSGTGRNTNASTIGTVAGGYFSTVLSGAGNVTNLDTVQVLTPTWSSSGVGVTTSGIHVKDQSKSGGTTSYGLLVDAQTQSGGAGTVFAALFNGGQVKIETGNTTTTGLLVNAASGFTGTNRVIQVNVNGTFKAGITGDGILRGQGSVYDPATVLTGNTTLSSASAEIQYGDTTSGGFTITLPTVSSAGNGKRFVITNTGTANTLSIATQSSQTFVAAGDTATASPWTLTTGRSVTIHANTALSKWVVECKNY